VLTNRAFALHQLDRYLEALQSSEEALAIDPDLANAFFIRGHALTKLQRYDEAVLSYDRVMTLEPDHRYAFGESVMNRLAACSWEGNEGLVRTLRSISTAENPSSSRSACWGCRSNRPIDCSAQGTSFAMGCR
jgi:tetratricopeptide (TPR) repeat protein